MVALRLAACWLGLIAPATVPEARGAGGVVVVDRLDVLDGPDDAAYASGELRRGDRVATVEGGRPGWLAIAPPPDAFDWVDAAAIRALGDGRGEVIVDRAAIRSGCADARMPGPPREPLPRGAAVRLIDRPPLEIAPGRGSRSWRAIGPTPGQVRYVRAEGIRPDPPEPPAAVDLRVQPAQFGRDADPAARFEDALRRSRERDEEVAQVKLTLAHARTGTDRGYDARGLLQASSRQVDGEKVHALIGPQGVPIAYLAIPPGIPTTRLLSRKVGVRGDVHYNEALGARLITVRDIDTLDKPR